MTGALALNWAFQTLVAGLSTIAFAIIFHTPRREWVLTAITGGVGWLVYIVAMHIGFGTVTASFFATVALAWLSRIFSVAHKAPATVYLICGIFPLVPGAGIYYTGYYFFMSNNSLGLSKGLETIKIAIAIALGIGIVLSLPRALFALPKPKKDRTESPTGGRDATQRSDHHQK